MDVLSAIIGGAIAGVPQIISHLLGSRKDRLARQLVHYERYLSEANGAFASYDSFVDSIERENRAPEEYELLGVELEGAFGAEIANEAMAALFARDAGIGYRVTIAKMKAHIAKLKQRAGHPSRVLA